jgi:hypothetical protein
MEKIGAYQDSNGYTWAFTTGPSDLVRQFAVRTQSTKFGIGSDGVILWRRGYGASDAAAWRGALRAMAEG